MHKYEIMDVIDEGAYGIVWKAANRQNGNLVAIKQFKESDQDETSRRTIQRQIKMLKMLKSQYVVGIKQAFKKKGKIYLIFQYFQKNLLNLIQKYDTGLEPTLLNKIIYKIIKCMQFLHSKNIVHRDIKPQNILLSADYEQLKICDFGFARFMPEHQYDLTDYVATRWYRSPQLLVGQPYGKASDMWALGCMIGQLVDAQPMFPGDDQLDQIQLIISALGDITQEQHRYFSENPKFSGLEIQIQKKQLLQMRYLGKIQKNALSFMKACLKIDPSQRLTVEQALQHPYLINLSMQDNQFHNDQQNLLENYRKAQPKNELKPIIKNESKASLGSNKDENRILFQQTKAYVEQQQIRNSKFALNNISTTKGLKLQVGSMEQRSSLGHAEMISKKKSHTNLQQNIKQSNEKKIIKNMSQQKGLKVNVDVNLKINLKINQKGNKMISDHIQSKLNQYKTDSKSKLPVIKSNNQQSKAYNLNIRHQKLSQLISVIGESKQLIRGSKPNLAP